MNIQQLQLAGVFLISLTEVNDNRGFFARSFCKKTLANSGLVCDYPQENISFNRSAGTLRGMHYQAEPHGETKLVSCTRGRIFDAVIDIRPNSPTKGQWLGVELDQNSKQILYIPVGFAHGFLTLEDNTEVYYHMSKEYAPGFDRCIHWSNTDININWPEQVILVSEKDDLANDLSWQN